MLSKLSLFDKYFTIFKFLSTWVLILVLLHQYTNNIFNLMFLTLFICIGCTYICFVYPRYYSFQFNEIDIKTTNVVQLLAIDILFHILLLVYVIKLYKNKYTLFSPQTFNAIMLIVFYSIVTDVKQLYHIRNYDIFLIIVIFILTLLFIQKI